MSPRASFSQTLAAFGRYRRRWSAVEGGGRFAAVTLAGFLALVLLDGLISLPFWLLAPLPAAATGAALVALTLWVLRPALRRIDPAQEALWIEARRPGLDNLLIGAWQMGEEMRRREHLPYSRLLAAEVVRRAEDEMRRFPPHQLVDRRRARHACLGAAFAALAWLALIALIPQVLQARLWRFGEAWLDMLDLLFPVTLMVEPGDIAVVRGSAVDLKLLAQGAKRRTATLVLQRLDAEEKQEITLPLRNNTARYLIASVDRSLAYWFICGRRQSRRAKVLVGDRPQIVAMNCELVYPAYTGLPPRTLAGRLGKIQAIAGTTALVSFGATTALHPELSSVEWSDGSRQALNVNGRFGHFTFLLDRPQRCLLRLVGECGLGFEMDPPFALEIAVERDQPPQVTLGIRKEKATMYAEEIAGLAVPYAAEDDFGVAEIALHYRIDAVDPLLGREPREGIVTRSLEPPAETAKGHFADIFKSLEPPLQPGERVRISLTAKDNNTETGPGVGRSRQIEIVIVQPDLAAFREQKFGFGQSAALAGLKLVPRATNLLVEPPKSVRLEKEQKVEKRDLAARVEAENWPSGAEDAVGDYFRLLSGGRQ